jgi:hypothetical protein
VSGSGDKREGPQDSDHDLARFERWHRNLTEIPEVQHELYGRLLAPEQPAQLFTLFKQLAILQIGAWRGHADSSWLIDPSLVRRCKLWEEESFGPPLDVNEETVRAVEADLVERARSVGIGIDSSELELLARLQHHGAATRLLDCTRSAFVALWFACREEPERDGLLIGFRLDEHAAKLSTDMLSWDLDRLLEHGEGKPLWWQPRELSPRIPAQQSVFVFGPVVEERWGSIRLGEGDIDVGDTGNVPGTALMLVSKELKSYLNSVWSSLFGFTPESLFPDLDGFASAHAVDLVPARPRPGP